MKIISAHDYQKFVDALNGICDSRIGSDGVVDCRGCPCDDIDHCELSEIKELLYEHMKEK